MLLWIILTLMTAAAAVWLSAPLLRRRDARGAEASELEVYRDQLAEVEREQADGGIDAEQAEAAGLEIKRRLLGAARGQVSGAAALSLGERHFAVTSVVGSVVLGSVILYSNSGRPDLPSVAREATTLVLGDRLQGATFKSKSGAAASRLAAPAGAGGTASGAAPTSPAVAGPIGGAGSNDTAGNIGNAGAAAASLGSVDDMIQRLVDRLKKDPTSVETWRMLGWSQFSTERYAEAAEAYKKAIELQPDNAGLQTSYGEALVRAADGEVKPDANAAFDKALALEPKEPRARFFKGLVQEQAGNRQAALDAWIAVLADAGPDDAWAADLRTRIVALAGELGTDVSARLPAAPAAATAAPVAVAPASGGILQKLQNRATEAEAPPPSAPPAPLATGRGPTAEAVKAAESMTPADRQAMIRSMVDGLAARLEKSPRDGDGWLQLIRSRRILGEIDAARDALGKALAAFADTPAEQARITAAAQELGVAR